jgi:membrane protease YdiL (CAAX protease family)
VKSLIHTPELHSFATAIVALYASTSGSFAGYLCARWLQATSFLLVYVVVMGLVLCIALWSLRLGFVTEHSISASIWGAPTGVTAGVAAVWGDRMVKRYVWRRRPGHRRVRRSSQTRAQVGPGSLRPLPIPESFALAPTGRRPTASPIRRVSTLTAPLRLLALLVSAAVLEETLFRGVLVELALGVHPWPVAAISVAVTAALFALMHIPFGLVEVLSKLPLSILALATVLALGTVVPAMLAHVLFNVWMWRAAAIGHHPVLTDRRFSFGEG